MIFYFNGNGNALSIIPERVFQGSNKASTVYFVCPTAITNTVSVAFALPDGTCSARFLMDVADGEGLDGVLDENGNNFNVWKYDLQSSITAQTGNVSVQFYITTAGGETVSTDSIRFYVERGVEPVAPEQGDSLTEFLEKLTAVISSNSEKTDKVENATDGNFASLDEHGNLTDSGKNRSDFVERKTTQGTYVYFHNGATQGEMEVKSSITPSDNEIPTSNGVINMVNILIADKQDKLDVEVPARVNADINLTLENNKEFRYGVLYGAINISFPSNPELDFICEVEIESLPSISYPNNIKWSGDDIENGVFVPDSQALTPYHILFYTSGVSNNIWNAIVRKPSV